MKTKMLLGLVVIAFAFGCANVATRYSLDPSEGEYSYTYEINKDKRTAYYLAEEWLSTNIQNANDVVTLRQVETGTLVARPSIQVPVGIALFWGRYTLRISCSDNSITTQYSVGTIENGTYPPRNAMPSIADKFRQSSLALRDYIINH